MRGSGSSLVVAEATWDFLSFRLAHIVYITCNPLSTIVGFRVYQAAIAIRAPEDLAIGIAAFTPPGLLEMAAVARRPHRRERRSAVYAMMPPPRYIKRNPT